MCRFTLDVMQSSEHALAHWRRAQGRNRPPRGSWGRALFARSCARTRSPIASSSTELLYMKMHNNLPANWRTCNGCSTDACKGEKGPPGGSKEASRHLHCVCRHELGNKSPHARAHLCKPLRLGYIYPPPMLVRVRESAIADYAPPTINVEKNFSIPCTTSFHA